MSPTNGLDVVGLPAGGWTELGQHARTLVERADVVVGAERHLDLLPPEGPRPGRAEGQVRLRLPARPRAELPGLLAAHDGAAVVVLASGDPLVAGLGGTLVEVLGGERVRVHPAVSSVALATARMGWDAAGVDVVRIGTTDAAELAPLLAPGRRVVALSRDVGSPAAIVAALVAAGLGASRVTVLGDLGTAAESRHEQWADEGAPAAVPRLHLVCVACAAGPGSVPAGQAAAWSPVPGLPDACFEHDGQLSKRVVRAAALAHLRPAHGELLWDLGAGAGSVAIEWCRAVPGTRAIAVEQSPERSARVGRNAAALGAVGVQLVTGVSTEALTWLPAPDAVFVGGGADDTLLRTVLSVLAPGGRLVVHAVTVETEGLLLALQDRHGGELTRIAVEDLQPLGRYRGWSPARAVVQWSLRLPYPAAGTDRP